MPRKTVGDDAVRVINRELKKGKTIQILPVVHELKTSDESGYEEFFDFNGTKLGTGGWINPPYDPDKQSKDVNPLTLYYITNSGYDAYHGESKTVKKKPLSNNEHTVLNEIKEGSANLHYIAAMTRLSLSQISTAIRALHRRRFITTKA